ncbi:hypothetical protein B0T24DRAFT_93051 [Lasiosphaeria ovina]|uniref:DUF7580 domain-containing protein n=1 Tax=Lasiosphaeria ovina TaxID=92902 RepID=A0AAE0NN50_9PEZI|nr:hypothetical protein B0T24DRAFT_93051 [Lasiosphaeria ovina]
MSGFEVVGVVFAVLPLFSKASKLYAQNAAAFHQAIYPKKRDEKLAEFYDTFWWDVYILRSQLEQVVSNLPRLSEERKQEIKASRSLDNWDKAADVGQALKDFFLSGNDYLAFQKVMSKVLSMLARLVKDDSVHISMLDTDLPNIFKKLKKFQEDRDAGSTLSTFWERFKFLRREKDRETCLKNLRTWNKRVGTVIGPACEAAERQKAVSAPVVVPESGFSLQLRTLSRRLFDALGGSWLCGCDVRHEARFCLASCGGRYKEYATVDQVVISFDFLVSHQHRDATGMWREGTVMIQKTRLCSNSLQGGAAELERVCDAIRDAITPQHCLQLLVEDVEDMEQTQRMWRLSWREPRLQYLPEKPPDSLGMLLEGCAAPSLVKRRRLALLFTHSLLQLHESPWLSDKWNNDRIHFFYIGTDVPDLERPYISTAFDDLPSGFEPPDLDCFHKNPGILRLGILLIEIHKWRPLKTFQTADDLVEGKRTLNTDLFVARRVLKTMDDCYPTYTKAINACLSVPWVCSGSRVSLEDQGTRNGLQSDVIQLLEKEVALGDN